MRVQLLSDLHLETEDFRATPAAGAEALLLGGDIDARWDGLAQFADWPVPVYLVAGNHEFDGRELDTAWPQLREHCTRLGIRLVEQESVLLTARDGRRIRLLGTVRWCDFDLFGAAQRERCLRAGRYFVEIMRATRGGQPLDAQAVRTEALACRAWLEHTLRLPTEAEHTVVVTHFGPSLRSADPRYGGQPGTASFCNADDDLLPYAHTWIHGHLHCRHDYLVPHARGVTRVVCNARGHTRRAETEGYDAQVCIEL